MVLKGQQTCPGYLSIYPAHYPRPGRLASIPGQAVRYKTGSDGGGALANGRTLDAHQLLDARGRQIE